MKLVAPPPTGIIKAVVLLPFFLVALGVPVMAQEPENLGGSVIYVSPSGDDDNSGYAADAPKLSVAAALTQANAEAADDNPVTIILASGTYRVRGMQSLEGAITLRSASGNRDDVEIARDTSAGNFRVLSLSHPLAKVEGVTISGGYTTGNTTEKDRGAGVAVYSGTLENCVVRGNTANSWNGAGGGVYVTGAESVVERCVVTNNIAYGDGTGVYANNGARVVSCLIAYNLGRIYYTNGGSGSTFFLSDSTTIGANCTVVYNRQRTQGGIFQSNKARIFNCITVFNDTWQTRSEDVKVNWNGTLAHSFYSLSDVKIGGTGCMWRRVNDFCDRRNGDFRLVPVVAGAIDAGSTDELPFFTAASKDLDGKPRISGGAIDIGCYEYTPAEVLEVGVCASIDEGVAPFEATFSAGVAGATGDVSFSWTIDDEEVGGNEANLTRTFGAEDYGRRRVVCTASDAAGNVAAFTNLVNVLPRTFYVVNEPNPNAAYPYASWATAADDPRDAIDAAITGCEIVLTNGVHAVSGTRGIPEQSTAIYIWRGITMRGAGKTPEETIIRCPNTGTIAILRINHHAAVVENLTFEGGRGHGGDSFVRGPGVSLYPRGGTLTNCIIRGVAGVSYNSHGPLSIGSADAVATHCIITNNSGGWGNSGAIGAFIDAGLLKESLIAFNYFDKSVNSVKENSNGTVNITGGTIRNCTIVSNCAYVTAGVRATAGSVENCVVAGNWLGTQGSYANASGTRAPTWSGTASCFHNCAFDAQQELDAAMMADCVSGDFASFRFKAPEAADFRFTRHSIAHNIGKTYDYMTTSHDLGGLPRLDRTAGEPNGGLVDAGCYETPFRLPGTLFRLQ